MSERVDAVIVGLGSAGGILAEQLTTAGLEVVGLEKGPDYEQADFEIKHDEEMVSYVMEEYYRKTGRPFRCCHPRDLLLLAKNNCQYRGVPPRMDKEMLDFATGVYFTVM